MDENNNEPSHDRALTAEEMQRARVAQAALRNFAAWNNAVRAWATSDQIDAMAEHPVPEFPVVELGPVDATIRYKGETFANVSLPAAEMLQFIMSQAPPPAGLQKEFGPHPERTLKQLPPTLFERCKSQPGKKGYIFDPL